MEQAVFFDLEVWRERVLVPAEKDGGAEDHAPPGTARLKHARPVGAGLTGSLRSHGSPMWGQYRKAAFNWRSGMVQG